MRVCPFVTIEPGVKWIESMVPATRERTSTSPIASSRPENSSHCTTCRSIAAATLTGIAGGTAGVLAVVAPTGA